MRRTIFFLVILSAALMSTASVEAQSFMKFDYRLSDIVYNPVTDRLYAAYSGLYSTGNSILVIHPQTGEIESTIPVRAEPYILRFSSNYQTLYIGFLGWNGMSKYHVPSGEVEDVITFTRVYENFGHKRKHLYYINELMPITGQPDGVVVVMRYNGIIPEDDITFVIDGAISRTDSVPDSDDQCRNLAYHSPTATVYGFGHEYRNEGLVAYKIDGSGITHDTTYPYLDGGRMELEIVRDRLYCQTGEVFDVSSGEPVVAGDIYASNGRNYYKGALEYDTLSDLIYNIDWIASPAGYHFYSIDPVDYTVVSRELIPGYGTLTPIKLISTGSPGRLALIAYPSPSNDFPKRGHLLLIHDCDEGTLDNILVTSSAGSNVCIGDTVTLSAAGNYPQYIWSNGMTGSQIQFVVSVNTTISVTGYDSNGCRQGTSTPNTFTIISPGNIAGSPYNYNICKGDSVTLHTNGSVGDYFIWSTGQQSPTITVSQPGYYTVQAYKGPGCTDGIAKGRTVNWYSDEDIPKPVISPSGPFDVCLGEEVVLTTHTNDYLYQWRHNSSPYDRVHINQNGDYQVRFIDAYGCEGPYSDTVSVSFHNLPPVPGIFKNDSLLYSNSPFELEWLLNGLPIPAPPNDSLIAIGTGFYSIRAVSAEGCYSKWTPGVSASGDRKIVNGEVFIDYNGNDTWDTGDIAFAHARVRSKPYLVCTYSNLDGLFSHYLVAGEHELFLEVDTALWEVRLGKDGHVIEVPGSDSVYVFSVVPKLLTKRMDARLWHLGTRCFRPAQVEFSVRNTGTQAWSGEVCFYVDDYILAVYENGLQILPLPDSLCWTITNLNPSWEWKHNLVVDMPGLEGIGKEIAFETVVKLDGGAKGGIKKTSILGCAFDPNDKLAFPARGSEGNYALFNDTIEYTIRFQNTGNDTAFIVVLEDQLSDNLRWETFQPLGASHDYSIELDLLTGELVVTFDPILLPDSTVNFLGSQGYFSFSILPKKSLPENTLLQNTADIYFDFNPAVITNTVELELVSQLPTSIRDVLEDWYDFNVIPNPHHEDFRLTFEKLDADVQLEIVDVLGRRWFSRSLENGMTEIHIDTQGWPVGLYLCRGMDDYHQRGWSGVVIKQ